MAEKRLRADDLHGIVRNQPDNKHRKTRPSFFSVTKDVVMVNAWENFCTALEPMLRRVVKEEVENGINHSMIPLTKSTSWRMQAIDSSNLQLAFSNPLSLPIFAGSKITTIDKNPLQILITKIRSPDIQCTLPHQIKIEIVVINGDFPYVEDENAWSNEEFDKHVVKERNGKRPLLVGEVKNITITNGVGFVGDVGFTDNSSWIRSRKFRLGARVVSNGKNNKASGVTIRSAITEAFVVKDHRSELYKKHYPPALQDEVWRLEKIRKDGSCHRKLSGEGIHTVQDFLKLAVIDSAMLSKILGAAGMSEKTRETTLNHAWTCKMGNKVYIYRGYNNAILLNPVCEFVNAVVDGLLIKDCSKFPHSAYIKKMVKYAYENWSSLEEVDAQVNNNTALLTTGDLENETSSQWIFDSIGFSF